LIVERNIRKQAFGFANTNASLPTTPANVTCFFFFLYEILLTIVFLHLGKTDLEFPTMQIFHFFEGCSDNSETGDDAITTL
jgi:hypothetical protein